MHLNNIKIDFLEKVISGQISSDYVNSLDLNDPQEVQLYNAAINLVTAGHLRSSSRKLIRSTRSL